MKLQLDMFTIELQEGEQCTLQSIKEENQVAEYEFLFSWTEKNAEANDGFQVSWTEPCCGMLYKWDSKCRLHRSQCPHWDDIFQSMISRNAPISCFFDGNDRNHYCWALSECKKLTMIKNGYNDQKGILNPYFLLRTAQYTGQYEAKVTLRIDKREISMRQAVEDTAVWWRETLQIAPMQVPAAAREPLYSFWYSHHQDVNEKNVEAECRRAKELGFEICIVDDGWQTEDLNGGYAYCGDWQPAPGKFPDMAAHVARVHEIGMKYVLWYSVPLMGYESKNYDRFQDMILIHKPELNTGVLDPRYKEVREFLTEVFKRELIEWDLDGFKLDFIDCWCDDAQNAPYNEKMDIPALQDAVDVCMSEIVEELLKVKPDLLLEFRQDYIGPHMIHLGNMFRVGDCAGDYLRNRTVILDLRMMMEDQAVHSDMLMLPTTDTPQNNAQQIISCMFGVLQYSGRLDNLSEENIEMSRFWLSFLKEHRALLQSRNLETHEAHLLYTWAKATEGNECAVGVYAIDKCIQPDAVDVIYIANGCAGERVLMELTGKYEVQVLDCFGHEVSGETKEFSGISQIPVPVGGLIILKAAE